MLIFTLALSLGLVACSHKHKWETAYSYNSEYHWHNCERKNCDETTGKEKHTFVDGKCKCGYTHKHTMSEKLTFDETTHFNICAGCGKMENIQKHAFDSNQICRGCGYLGSYYSLDYELSKDGRSYIVTSLIQNELKDTKMQIPEYHNGKPVTGIKAEAFAWNESLEKIILSDNIVDIGDKAFTNSINLSEIVLGKNVKSIGYRAFNNCTALSQITIPESVVSIGTEIFNNCYGITIYCEAKSKPASWDISDWSIDFNYKLPVVWDCKNNNISYEYDKNGNIVASYEYVIIDNVKYAIKIGETAEILGVGEGKVAKIAVQHRNNAPFNLKTSFKHNNETYYVNEIGDYAFYNHKELSVIDIPRLVERIGEKAFANCDGLVSVKWATTSAQIKELGIACFSGCTSLLEITIPESVTKIESSAFYGSTKLTIKCEAAEKPAGWSEDWDYKTWDTDNKEELKFDVIWDCKNK